ncbi:Low molecular weight phosphotyrosine protein phosphatase, partial [Cryomyces antarcticus]
MPTTDPTSSPPPVSVLFVCLGNICATPSPSPLQPFPTNTDTAGRSPMAEGVFQHVAQQATQRGSALVTRTDSAGTGAYHVGDAPDPRTMATLAAHGIGAGAYSHRAPVPRRRL